MGGLGVLVWICLGSVGAGCRCSGLRMMLAGAADQAGLVRITCAIAPASSPDPYPTDRLERAPYGDNSGHELAQEH
jgi:hypothetical protein